MLIQCRSMPSRPAPTEKNNRYPLTQLEVDDVQESLDRLRELGAIAEVQGAAVSLDSATTCTIGWESTKSNWP